MSLRDPQDFVSPLYRSIRRLRFILPITAFITVVIHQSLAYTWFHFNPSFLHFVWQVLLYGTVGPVVVWFALNWFARWIQERDEAEAHLNWFYRISRQAATATELEALVDAALNMPAKIIQPAATSLILREYPEGPWTLAGTRGLQAREEEVLAARLTIAGSDLYCGECTALTATSRQHCPLQFHLPQADILPSAASVICLPLSIERPPLALLNVYLFTERGIPPRKRRVLESLAAVLSVALDHARLRTREFEMLGRMEQATRQPGDLSVTLEHILADMARVHRAQAGAVFLTSGDKAETALVPVACWPEPEPRPGLLSAGQQALSEEDTILVTKPDRKENIVAIPLMAEGWATGVLVLNSRYALNSSQQAFLQVAASMVALIISNSQLYAKLERQVILEERNRLAREVHDGLAQSLGFLNFKIQHIDRSLARQRWDAVRQGLGEMHDALQGLYSEVRLTIQDLRWSPEDGPGLPERLDQFVTGFAERSGLKVSLVVEGEPTLSPRDEVHLFRIVQEALTNVHKHAQANHAWVRLSARDGGTTLEVEDDGVGMPSTAKCDIASTSGLPGHFGLRIMQERAEAIGGQLSVHSSAGQGTCLQVTVDGPHMFFTSSLSRAPESN